MTMDSIDFEEFADREELIQWLLDTGKVIDGAGARQWITQHVPLEKVWQAKILQYLRDEKRCGGIDRNAFIWKASAGPYQRSGIPDVWCITGGKTFCFEIKRPFIGQLTGVQSQTIRDLNAAGAIAAKVSYISEVEAVLRMNGAME
jgi:hypothetical protein